MSPPEPRFAARQSEPFFRAPPLAVLVALSMPLLFVYQLSRHDFGLTWAFVPARLWDGGWPGLFTSMLLHGGWAHVAMNAIAGLTFGAPVARALRGPGGAIGFLALYIVSGALAALAYGLLHLGSETALVGASGAVFGLIGAATRLMGVRGGRPRSLFDGRVLGMSAVWMGLNVVVGVLGVTPGMGDVGVAWEAHAAGFVIGILAIGPLHALFGKPVAPETVLGHGPWGERP